MTPSQFTAELITMFGPPDTLNPAGYKRRLEETLKAFPEPALELGCDRLIDEWKWKRWPSQAEIRKYCGDAAARLARHNPSQKHVINRLWVEAGEFAEKFFESRGDGDLIDQAEREGWTADLHGWVKTQAHGKLIADKVPQITGIFCPGHVRKYYRVRAAAARAAAEHRKSDLYKRKHVDGKFARRLRGIVGKVDRADAER